MKKIPRALLALRSDAIHVKFGRVFGVDLVGDVRQKLILALEIGIKDHPEGIDRRNGVIEFGRAVSRQIICLKVRLPVDAVHTVVALDDDDGRRLGLGQDGLDDLQHARIDKLHLGRIALFIIGIVDRPICIRKITWVGLD